MTEETREPLTKAQFYEIAKVRAERFRKDGENIHLALGRFWQTDEGGKLRLAMERSDGIVSATPRREAPACLNLPSLKKATEAAQQLRAGRPELTLERARAAVWKGDPDLLESYNRERAALLT